MHFLGQDVLFSHKAVDVLFLTPVRCNPCAIQPLRQLLPGYCGGSMPLLNFSVEKRKEQGFLVLTVTHIIQVAVFFGGLSQWTRVKQVKFVERGVIRWTTDRSSMVHPQLSAGKRISLANERIPDERVLVRLDFGIFHVWVDCPNWVIHCDPRWFLFSVGKWK